MRKSRVRAQRGETLIEAMISLAILSVGLLGILQMNGHASRQSGTARKETISAAIARDLVDAFERLPYDHPALNPSGMTVSAGFVDPAQPTGLHSIEDLHADERPLLGAAHAAYTSDLNGTGVDVHWRVAQAGSTKRIAILITYQTGIGQRQLTVWTSKPNLADVLGGERAVVPEI